MTFSRKDGSDTDRFELRLMDTGQAELQFLLSDADREDLSANGIPTPKPIRLMKQGPSDRRHVRIVQLDRLHVSDASGVTWIRERACPHDLVRIPLGAGAKEHGPHLRLDNDLRMAQYFADRVLAAADVVVAPTVPYHFYPAFLEYPGRRTSRRLRRGTS